MDRGTWHSMAGKPYLMRIMGFGFRRPKNRVPGLDVAGTVVAVGSEVTRFEPGDEVFGIEPRLVRRVRRLYERTSSPTSRPVSASSRRRWFRSPAGPPSRVCATPAASRPGQKVLIIGASGGVGTYAVQLAKAFGAEVTGVSSTAKLDLVRSIGADHVIDYTREDYVDGAHRYDLILDIGGNSSLSRLRRALTPKGTLVIVGGEEGGNLTGGFGRQLRALALSLFVGQTTDHACFQGAPHRPRSADAGSSRAARSAPVIDRTYPLAEVPEAMTPPRSRAGTRKDRHHDLTAGPETSAVNRGCCIVSRTAPRRFRRDVM